METIVKNAKIVNHICKIYFNYADDVQSLTKIASHKLSIEFISNDWTEIEITPPAKLSESSENTFSGELYKSALSFLYPGEEDTNQESLKQILGKPLVLKLLYENGVAKIMGSAFNPVYLKMVRESSPTDGTLFSAEWVDLSQNYWLI